MSFQVALAQFDPVRKNVNANIKKIKRLVSGLQVDLLVLPELSNTGYMFNSMPDLKPYSEPGDGSGKFLSALRSISKSTQGLIIAGYSELDKGKLYNSAAAVSPDGVIANYRKIHLYLNEKDLFESGDTGFSIVEWKNVKIGIMICFDWVFPEAARTLALAGAQIIAHPANLVLPYCQSAMVTRSIENRIFTITANRIGKEKLGKDSLLFTGQSQMTSPDGKILYRGPKNKPTVHITSIDPEEALDKSISKRNDLFKDRRTGSYQLN